LSEDPKVEFNYLYEEEPTRSHAGLIAVLLLLVAGGGYLGWQWRHHGVPFNRLNASSGSAQPAPPASSGTAPDASQSQAEKPADKPATGTGDVLPTAPDQTADAAGTASKTPAPEGKNTASPQDDTTRPAEKAESAKATPPPIAPKKSHTTKLPSAPAPAPKPAKVETASLATPPDADLELAGERYLYGSGLPQNCSRAESSLRTAAMHGNTKAQTVLGTMYATGHCVGRDLPTSYRWFARALHQDPQNTRISADLQVLWRQMTPQEKQLATGSKQ
jgi:TPR repeat protein